MHRKIKKKKIGRCTRFFTSIIIIIVIIKTAVCVKVTPTQTNVDCNNCILHDSQTDTDTFCNQEKCINILMSHVCSRPVVRRFSEYFNAYGTIEPDQALCAPLRSISRDDNTMRYRVQWTRTIFQEFVMIILFIFTRRIDLVIRVKRLNLVFFEKKKIQICSQFIRVQTSNNNNFYFQIYFLTRLNHTKQGNGTKIRQCHKNNKIINALYYWAGTIFLQK